ncbi:MAG: hypothetical protein IKR25_06145 [Muribaculaceae bacterium]|nr:hypothetical protein [Muribaculaceae bacterium]
MTQLFFLALQLLDYTDKKHRACGCHDQMASSMGMVVAFSLRQQGGSPCRKNVANYGDTKGKSEKIRTISCFFIEKIMQR